MNAGKMISADKRRRKKERQKQRSKSYKLRKKLTKNLCFAPCYYCKYVFLVEALTLEHIVPFCLGGTNDIANLTLACRPCNHSRGREAWFQKQRINKNNYEQYYSEHRIQDRQIPVQDIGTPFMYCKGEGV